MSIELDIEGARPGNLSNKPTYSVPYATRAHVGRVVIYVCGMSTHKQQAVRYVL